MTVDKILLEVLNNRFTGIVEEMGYVIHRAAFTTFVKETWDFDSALITTDGEVFAYPRNIGVTNMLSMSMTAAINCFDSYEPGDVVLTNDPLHARGMCTHLPDYMMFRPIFADGRLICFAWCFVHSSDVGGIVPGSITPHASDRFQEGVVIPPVKLFKAGALDIEAKRFILANCRIPEQNWGDICALTAALATAERRLDDCLGQYGAATVSTMIGALLDYGEVRARAVISALPEGRYEFSDYMEGDLLKTHHVRIKLALEKKGSDILLDFSGTDPQVNAAFNLPTHGMLNQFLVLGVVNFLRTSDPALPFNRGMVRPIRVKVPEGTILNPTKYAATGIRYTTALRVSDVVMGTLSQAAPDRVPAAGSGQFGLLTLSDLEPESGNYIVHVLEPLQGGSGGRPGKDGIDGVNFSGGALRNAPIEALELDCPIFVTGYRLNDAVAPGKWRGGSGILLEFQLLSPNAQVSSRGWDRFHFRPWGRAGGAGGTPGRTYLIDADGTARTVPKIEVLRLAPGQTVRIVSPGGGGFGSPLERDPAAVVLDVEDGFVAVDEALEKYGVVIRSGKVDAEATALARKSAAQQGKPGAFFNFGAERAAYEERLPQGFQDMVVEILSRQPISSRQHLRVTIYDYALNAKGGLPSRTDIEALIASLTDEARKPVLRWVSLAAVA